MLKKIIKCPLCHHAFEVSNPEGADRLIVRCPVTTCGVNLRVTFATGHTILADSPDIAAGCGYLLYAGRKYPLREGVNIVGREADISDAGVQIETNKLYMSRRHFAIEHVPLRKNRTKYIVRDIRDEVKIVKQPTLVNGEALAMEDRIVLRSGDDIVVGEVNMKFCLENKTR